MYPYKTDAGDRIIGWNVTFGDFHEEFVLNTGLYSHPSYMPRAWSWIKPVVTVAESACKGLRNRDTLPQT